MLSGYFDPRGRPYLEARVLADSGLVATVQLVVDTGSERTAVHGAVAVALLLPDQRAEFLVMGIAGAARYSQRPVLLLFDEPGVGTRAFGIDLLVAGPGAPPVPSILGQDVLRHLAMTHDPSNGVLTFEVRHADVTLGL